MASHRINGLDELVLDTLQLISASFVNAWVDATIAARASFWLMATGMPLYIVCMTLSCRYATLADSYYHASVSISTTRFWSYKYAN